MFVSLFSTSDFCQSDPVVELFLKGDRYHPNPKGYRIVAEGVVRLVLERNWALEGR